ncbi:acyl-CoA dehydrogenase [Hoyosella sp. YIM 151337]|uniref:acyl-CoA dehydrogenase n=1 Tax=Hoyosella sp. YIM 151337 TaxID=2992742 RepID=UPI00223673F1|nr:acyl-CoA dehydrogenase [Hoyosella sp. YIM 151337]MCW4353384.1 acyl-CoA dehydrogenase [Hoyosella sp. YIM 151337]
MPIASTDTQRELARALHAWARRADPRQAVRSGDAQAGWTELAEIGVFGVAVPEELGGAGGSVADAAAGLEAAAEAFAPGPLLPTVLAATILARYPDAVIAKETVPTLVTGQTAAGVAVFTPGEVQASETGNTGLVLTGSFECVFGATEDGYLLIPVQLAAGERWVVVPPRQDGMRVEPRELVDLGGAAGRVRFDNTPLAADAVVHGLTSAAVRDLAATLASAEASGIAAWSLKTAAEYAKTREQFGAKIGAFQAVKHLCATMLCRAEKAAALAWDAACAISASEGSLSAAAAAAACLDAAVDNAKDCIQVLGGIGFTWEHDAHLYLRRAVSLRQLLGGSDYWLRATTDLAARGARRQLHLDVSPGTVSADWIERVRADVAEISALPTAAHRQRLVEMGYFMPHWPAPYGLAATPAQQLIIDEELEAAGITRPSLVIGGWAGATILEHGSDTQRARFLRPTLLGDIAWCQLFSEPEAGSDLASLRTRAVPADGGWRLTGSKVWTSLAHEADWAICLARTNPDVPKHKGITYFLLDMRSAGIDIRPLREITGEERFNEVFLDDVFVPCDCVVGAEGDGWKLARTTLANERVSMSAGDTIGGLLERLLEGLDGTAAAAPRVGALITDSIAGAVLDLRSVLNQIEGEGQHGPGAASSVRKLIGVTHRQEVAETALELLGTEGALADSAEARSVQHEFLLTRCLSIAGGTTEILKNVAAERLLGLPR